MQVHIEILIIALLTAIACVLPGVFLVLRGVALMSDALSHSVLLGIAVMFLLIRDLDSPLLLLGAALAGIATVFLTELIIQSRRLKEDAAIGIVFPLFFSCGIILISLFARDVHLDVDMVILGEIAFAPFNRLYVFGYDIGPVAYYTLSMILALNAAFIVACYKELKLAIFDHDFAYVIGFSPTIIYYCLMFLTSITAVGSFDIVGSIVVVALMITPATTALLLVNTLEQVIATSILISVISVVLGYSLAIWFDVSIAGSIATASGILFLLAFLFSPQKGVMVRWYRRSLQDRLS